MTLSDVHLKALSLLRDRGSLSLMQFRGYGVAESVVDDLHRWRLVQLIPGHHDNPPLKLTDAGRRACPHKPAWNWAHWSPEQPAANGQHANEVRWNRPRVVVDVSRCSARRSVGGRRYVCGRPALATGKNGEPLCVYCEVVRRKSAEKKAS